MPARRPGGAPAARTTPVRRAAALALAPLAAGALGVIVMVNHGTPRAQVGFQIGILVLGAALAPLVAKLGIERLAAAAPWAALVALAVLLGTLAGEGTLTVHRWIALGPIRVHASSIASPLILVGAATLLSRGRVGWAGALLLAAQAIHALQPDAGQATSFAVGASVLLALGARPDLIKGLVAIAVAGTVVLTWSRLDPLLPVPIVEGIVGLAGDLGRPAEVLAVLLLAAIPVTLALALAMRRAAGGDSIADGAGAALIAYLAATLIVPLFGNYPVPVMGFGASPILGVAVCIGVVATG